MRLNPSERRLNQIIIHQRKINPSYCKIKSAVTLQDASFKTHGKTIRQVLARSLARSRLTARRAAK